MVLMEEGIKAGNELVKEILLMGVVSKYRMARDLGVEDATIYNWLKGLSSPNIKNYLKLKNYRLYAEKLKNLPRFKV